MLLLLHHGVMPFSGGSESCSSYFILDHAFHWRLRIMLLLLHHGIMLFFGDSESCSSYFIMESCLSLETQNHAPPTSSWNHAFHWRLRIMLFLLHHGIMPFIGDSESCSSYFIMESCLSLETQNHAPPTSSWNHAFHWRLRIMLLLLHHGIIPFIGDSESCSSYFIMESCLSLEAQNHAPPTSSWNHAFHWRLRIMLLLLHHGIMPFIGDSESCFSYFILESCLSLETQNHAPPTSSWNHAFHWRLRIMLLLLHHGPCFSLETQNHAPPTSSWNHAFHWRLRIMLLLLHVNPLFIGTRSQPELSTGHFSWTRPDSPKR